MDEIVLERKPIKLKRFDISEFVAKQVASEGQPLKVVNIRGTNASGKSTVPLQMLANDRGAYILTKEGNDVATVFPNYNFVAVGRYRTKTGGLDGIKTTAEAKELLDTLHVCSMDILFEGILCSTVFSTWAEQLKKHQNTSPNRKAGVLNIVNDLEVVKERLMKRNGGKEVKMEQIESKWKTVKKNVDKFREYDIESWETTNFGVPIEGTLQWFFNELKKNMGA